MAKKPQISLSVMEQIRNEFAIGGGPQHSQQHEVSITKLFMSSSLAGQQQGGYTTQALKHRQVLHTNLGGCETLLGKLNNVLNHILRGVHVLQPLLRALRRVFKRRVTWGALRT